MNQSAPRAATVADPLVAVSDITVPESGRGALIAAFAQRLRAVEAWPGFQSPR